MFQKLVSILGLAACLAMPMTAVAQNTKQGPTKPRQVAPAPKTKSVPVCNPVQGSNGAINTRDAKRGQGSGQFGSPRDGGRTHKGIDIKSSVGKPVYAAKGGRVEFSGAKKGYGKTVDVKAKDGTMQRYAHLRGDKMPPRNSTVAKGGQVGTVGRTGNVPAKAQPHLHFETHDSKGKPKPPALNGQSCGPSPVSRPAPVSSSKDRPKSSKSTGR